MAIYALSMTVVQRAKGHSATGAAAYRCASRIIDSRTGLVHDYSRKIGVVSSQLYAPCGVEFTDRAGLWNSAEAAEKRKDAAVARDILIALPAELDDAGRATLVDSFARRLVSCWGVAVDANIHRPSRTGDARNHHAHLLMTMRAIRPDGSHGDRVSALANQKTGSAELDRIRSTWQDMVNVSLATAGISETVSAASLSVQRHQAEVEASTALSDKAAADAIDRAELLAREPEPKIGASRGARDRITIERCDGQVSDAAVLVGRLRQRRTDVKRIQKQRRSNANLPSEATTSWKARHDARSARLRAPGLVDAIDRAGRRRIGRAKVIGREGTITAARISQVFAWINSRLREYGLTIPPGAIEIISRGWLACLDRGVRESYKPASPMHHQVADVREASRGR